MAGGQKVTCYLLGFGGSLDELAPLEPCKVTTVIKVVSLVIKINILGRLNICEC